MTPGEAVRKVAAIVGSQYKLARLLGVSDSMIYNWIHRDRNASPRYILKLEALSQGKVTRYQLAPDIFGKE